MSRASSPTSTCSSIGNGSGAAALSTSTVSAMTSISPDGRFGFALPSGRSWTVAGDRDAVLAAQAVRDALVADHDLGDAAGLAQVEEGHAAVVAAAGDPAGEGDGLAGVGGREGAGVVGADHESCSLLMTG